MHGHVCLYARVFVCVFACACMCVCLFLSYLIQHSIPRHFSCFPQPLSLHVQHARGDKRHAKRAHDEQENRARTERGVPRVVIDVDGGLIEYDAKGRTAENEFREVRNAVEIPIWMRRFR